MSQHSVMEWFFRPWLKSHQEIHGSRYWVKWDADEAIVHYRGWVEAFERWRVTPEEADEVTRRLQEIGVPGPNKQLPVIKDALYSLRRSRKVKDDKPATETRSAGEIAAEERSGGCPECTDEKSRRPTGWARRRFKADGFPWALFVELYCRCPLGRFRERSAPDRGAGEARHFSDLQLLMELWDGTLHHDSWDYSDPPVPSYHVQGVHGGRYLTPREAERYRLPTVERIARGVIQAAAHQPAPPRPAFVPEIPKPLPATEPIAS